MTQSIEFTSPAKINLFLDLLGKRNDGYHDIITVFEKIDLCDRIIFSSNDIFSESGNCIRISSNLKGLPTDSNNLVFRACSLLKEKFNILKGVSIHIEKRIPVAAGLGGGSSNSAATLKGLNRLWNLDLTEEELCDMGRKIGADVPFFIFNHAFAVGSERGDHIEPIKSDLEMWHVIISPPARVLTADIYEKSNLSLTQNKPDVKMIVRAIEQKNAGGVKSHLYNALEHIVTKDVTDISRVKDFIKKMGFGAIKVAGSGPAIFVLTRNEKEAEKLREDLLKSFISGEPGNGWKIFVARTCH